MGLDFVRSGHVPWATLLRSYHATGPLALPDSAVGPITSPRLYFKKAAMSAAEAGLKKAEDAAAAVLGPRGGVDSSDEDSDDGVRLRHRLVLTSSSSGSGVKEDDLRGLESAAKRAKTAGSTLPQVCT